MPTNNTPPITIQGKQFVNSSTQTRFMVRGVALDTRGVPNAPAIKDILADQHSEFVTSVILPELIALGVNVVRVYDAYPENSHVTTMAAFEAVGIYVMLGLATSEYSIDQLTGTYNFGLYQRATALIDEFQAYDNTFCLSIGNEVEFPGTQAASFNIPKATPQQVTSDTVTLELTVAGTMKSLARDIKAYIAAQSYRTIPVGLARQDGPQSSFGPTNQYSWQQGILGTDTIAQYYAAGPAEDAMDYVAVNAYRYLTGANAASSANDGLANEASLMPVPVFLSEDGAVNTPPPAGFSRDWADVLVQYTSALQGAQLSGQVAFEFFEKLGNHGLFTLSAGTAAGSYVLTPTSYGGATALAAANVQASTTMPQTIATTPVSPTSNPPAPSNCAVSPLIWPSLLEFVEVTVQNYATVEIQITQLQSVAGTVAPGTASTPTVQTIRVIQGVHLSIQGNAGGNWDEVCFVSGADVTSGITIANNVTWGNACALPSSAVAP